MTAPIVTLSTDFGQSDYDAGVLSGVIWSIAPQARLIDLSHAIGRHNVLEATLLLERCTPYFPSGTIHLVVVDPGVGTARRGLAARLGQHFFVGPDNGLLTPLLERARSSGGPLEIVHLDQPRFWLPEVSAIFHGRDVFAPVAAHLANGVRLSELGSPISDPKLLELPHPQRVGDGWRGVVQHVDAFGNLSTNLEHQHVPSESLVKIRIEGVQIDRLSGTYGDGEADQLIALFDSAGKLSICVVNGSAADRLHAEPGDQVDVILNASAASNSN
jgi:S-adenosylmethionine hydrolase